MSRDQDFMKLLRAFPFLDEERQQKAIAWMKRNGYSASFNVPREQQYLSPSPSKRGQLVRIPMYLENIGTGGEGAGYYNTSLITDAGAGAVAQNNSTVMLNIDGSTKAVLSQYNSGSSEDSTFGHFCVKALTFSTRQTPWSKMRVLGIETVSNHIPSNPLLPDSDDVGTNTALGIGYASPPRVLLKNFRVSGSANLFLQDGYIDGTFFDVDRFDLGGLRAYPILESPKTLKVQVAVSGEHYHGSTSALGTTLELSNGTAVPQSTGLSFSVNAIVDILEDDEFGIMEDGPYARGLNMKRVPPAGGQSFIVGE
jgi:hypothetical protein